MSVLSQAQAAAKACNWFIFHFCVCFPCETTKKTAVSQAVRIHHIHLVFMHGCFHVFDKYQPKSAAERASCRCNRKILLSAYLFATMYPSASEKFLHPSDSSSPDLSCLCRHYSCWETGRTFTSHPLAILVAGLRRFDNLFIKVHFYEQTVNDESFLFSFN